ncbi:hypothetical protein [Plasmodium yoelii yoelii]|uniref:Uncharacterized protein n=1 Tax=Plasmodium yoelii yoelii TaxID=73239 RepID=Q7R9X3_PLAYO|nr:hypothetical protein [Plasmodium yoelii yoelii]
MPLLQKNMPFSSIYPNSLKIEYKLSYSLAVGGKAISKQANEQINK